MRRVAVGAVGELAGQRRRLENALAPRQFARVSRRVACALRGYRLHDEFLRLFGILFQIRAEGVGNGFLDLQTHAGVAELGLGLTLELRLGQFDGNDRRQALANVLARELVVLFYKVLLVRVVVDDFGQRVLESDKVRAALLGVDVVGVGIDKLAVPVVILYGVLDLAILEYLFAVDDLGEHRFFVAVEVLDEVLDTAVETERIAALSALAVVNELYFESLVEVRDLAETRANGVVGEVYRLEYLVVGEERYLRARLVRLADLGERLHRHAAIVALTVYLAVFIDLDVQPFGKRVDARHTDAVQTARHLVSAAAELTARVQLGQNDLDRRHLFFGVYLDGYAAPVVRDGDRAVARDLDEYLVAVPRERFVDGVIDYLGYEVMQTVFVGRTDIHARTLANGLEPLQYLNGTRTVTAVICLSRHKTLLVTRENDFAVSHFEL